MAFLSLLDERARPKGSRDPLGFEMVWTYFGRKVVGNLTTITSSWRIFAVGLLGFHWCNQLCRDKRPTDKQQALQEHFIRYEQLAAFLRFNAGDEEIMGITRVRRRVAEQGKTLRIGTEQQHLILSDQISYGIWGLYSTALRESGLVRGDDRELTDKGLEIVGKIEASLDRNWYWSFLRGERKSVAITDLELQAKHFVESIEMVKDELISSLLKGPVDHHCQQALYVATREISNDILKQDNLVVFISEVRAKTDSLELRQALDDISHIERLLVTANTLFNYCRRKNDVKLTDVAEVIGKEYNFDFLPPGPVLGDCPYAEDLGRLRALLSQGQVLDALSCLLDMNKKVMAGRGGAAWVEENRDGRLRVRVNAETAFLPPIQDLQNHWDYDYFLRSFARVARESR